MTTYIVVVAINQKRARTKKTTKSIIFQFVKLAVASLSHAQNSPKNTTILQAAAAAAVWWSSRVAVVVNGRKRRRDSTVSENKIKNITNGHDGLVINVREKRLHVYSFKTKYVSSVYVFLETTYSPPLPTRLHRHCSSNQCKNTIVLFFFLHFLCAIVKW